MSPREGWILTRDSCFFSMLVLVGTHMLRAYPPYFVTVQSMEHIHKVGLTSADACA